MSDADSNAGLHSLFTQCKHQFNKQQVSGTQQQYGVGGGGGVKHQTGYLQSVTLSHSSLGKWLQQDN